MIPKKKTDKTTTKKVVKKEVEEKIEDKKVEEDIPKRYYVQFWARVQPSEPRYDEMVGTIYWSDVRCKIEIEALHNKYSSMIENLPLEAQYWLGLTEKEYNEVKGVDRSDLIITLARKLYKYKYNEDDIFSLLEPAHFNKFKNRPKTLYQQIKKAKNF